MNKKSEIIKVTNLVKKFGDFSAVNDVSFEVKKGEIFAFLGPNGAGKTTTIKMLTTLLHQTEGEIFVNTFDPKTQQAQVRNSIGIVFQDSSVDDDLTAYENMEFHTVLYHVPAKLRKERIEYLMQFVGLWERKNDLVKTFSGGMKRRLEIARALTHHPKILFLDEPTLGLDPQTRNHMWDYIIELNQKEGMTVFFTTHYMNEAEKYASRVAIIDNGKIIKMGTPQFLKKDAKADSLEAAFLKLTGHKIRDEEASGIDMLRNQARVWGRRR